MMILRTAADYSSLGIPLESNLSPTSQLYCPNDKKGRGSVTLEEARLLSALSFGRDVIEFGTGLGVSTYAICQTARTVVTIDPDAWVRDNVILPPNCFRHVGTFADMQTKGTFGMAFIDGLHEQEDVAQDIRDALKVVPPGGLLVFHDYNQLPVRDAVDLFKSLGNLTSYDTTGRLTVAVVR